MTHRHTSTGFLTWLMLLTFAATLLADEEQLRKQREEQRARQKVLALQAMERRAMIDLVRLPLEKMTEGWCLVEIEPGPHSGAWYLVAYGDPLEKGFDDVATNSHLLYEGNWKRLAGTGKSPDTPREGKFRWEEPYRLPRGFERRVPITKTLAKVPFEYPGTVLCRFDPKFKNKNPFHEELLLPSGAAWITAAREIVEEPELVEATLAAIQTNRFPIFKKKRNPLLAIYTARRLLEKQELVDARRMQAIIKLWRANELAQSALAFLLTRPPADAAEISDKIFTQLVTQADSKAELTALTEGLRCSSWISGREMDYQNVRDLKPYYQVIHTRAIDLRATELIERIQPWVKAEND